MATLSFLCVGTPTPAATGFGTAILLSVSDERILVDCGPAATYKLMGARLGQIDPPSRTAALTEMREALSGAVVFAEELGPVELCAIQRAGEEATSSRAPRRRSPRPTLG